MLAVSGLPSLSATGPANPEITDSAKDVSPAAFFADTDPKYDEAFQNLSAYDLVQVYVLLETRDDLLLQFKVRDLPDEWSLPADVRDEFAEGTHLGPNASQPSVVLAANFTIRGVPYEALANLSQPSGQGVIDSYSIGRRGYAPVSISGSFDAFDDTVTLSIRKILLGSPKNNDVLTKFRAEGRFGAAKLDFAPDATSYEPTGAPDVVSIILNTLVGQQLVKAEYGMDYTFRWYSGSGSLALDAPSKVQTVPAGSFATYNFQVKNTGSAADTVYLTLSNADAGYVHRLSEDTLALAPGESKAVQLYVSTAQSARGLALSIIEAKSRLGGSDSALFETTIAEPGSTPVIGGSQGPDAQNPGSASPDGSSDTGSFKPTRDRSKGAPAPMLLPALAAVVGLVAVLAFWRGRKA